MYVSTTRAKEYMRSYKTKSSSLRRFVSTKSFSVICSRFIDVFFLFSIFNFRCPFFSRFYLAKKKNKVESLVGQWDSLRFIVKYVRAGGFICETWCIKVTFCNILFKSECKLLLLFLYKTRCGVL